MDRKSITVVGKMLPNEITVGKRLRYPVGKLMIWSEN